MRCPIRSLGRLGWKSSHPQPSYRHVLEQVPCCAVRRKELVHSRTVPNPPLGARQISLFLNPRARALLQAPADTAIPVAASDLDGVNIWLLNQLASAGNFTIDYFIYKLPVGLQGVADSSAILSYLLSTKGYDCVTTGVQVTAARSALVNFLVPTEPFGYVAVTGLNFRAFVIAKIEDDVKSWVKNLFFWVVPFSNGVRRAFSAS